MSILFLCIIPYGGAVSVLKYSLQKLIGRGCLGTELRMAGKSGVERGISSLKG